MDEEGGEWDEAKAAGSLKEFLKAVVYQGPLANRTWKRELCDCSLTQPCQVRWPDEVGEGFVGWGERKLEFVKHAGGIPLVETTIVSQSDWLFCNCCLTHE